MKEVSEDTVVVNDRKKCRVAVRRGFAGKLRETF
jgi:hypothetical protein